MSYREKHLEDDPLWYKDVIIYELHIKAFSDSTATGTGDFGGLIERLDYLESLGVTAIWLLPFYPSPLRDDGYDIADYFSINPDYGTLQKFRLFLKEAHRRGLRVITELVVNHTSDQHPWFQRARTSKPGSVWRDFYVWSDTPEKYKDARIIFKDFEASNWTWDAVAGAYYWHRFYSHQPDLNYENPRVKREIFRVMDFWFRMGVDGMRMDAIPYLYERDGTNCENLPETFEFLRELRAHVDSNWKNRLLLAEANQWPEDAVAYFGKGDMCHMAFHFPVMPRMFMALRMEDRFPLIDIIEQTPEIHESCQWAMFLRNHDELTLEMVTDEERDYMYRVYASDPRAKINLGIRRRLAPLLDNNRRKIELMNILLFSLPGTPVIYYGDEIGMGDNFYLGDRDGVRTPMQWSADRNSGFSRANPQKLYLPVIIDPEYNHEAINVETQKSNMSSLLWWMKRTIGMRRRFKAFGRGSLEFLSPANWKVLAFIRRYEDEIILVVANLSRFSQPVELDLSDYAGYVPEDAVSQNLFPVITDAPYTITLGPYDYYWFSLEREEQTDGDGRERIIPELAMKANWKTLLRGDAREELEEEILPDYLRHVRWFGGKARSIQRIRIADALPVANDISEAQLALLEVAYTEGATESYLLPLSFVSKSKAGRIAQEFPQSVIARLRAGKEEAALIDAVYDEKFREALLSLLARKRRIKAKQGEIEAVCAKKLRALLNGKGRPLRSRVLKAEQSNTAILYGDKYFLKLYRRADEGINPDPEIVRFLSEKARFANVPAFAGAIGVTREGAQPSVLALVQEYVPNNGDAWAMTLEAVGRYFERVLSMGEEIRNVPQAPPSLLDVDYSEASPLIEECVQGFYLEMSRLLGHRTGEMHLALASRTDDPDFRPEPYSMLYQRSVYQSMRSLTRRTLQLINKNLNKLPDALAGELRAIVASEPQIMNCLGKIKEKKLSAAKIRIHGDYHLGQVLYTGKDFMIIDFEGEPVRPVSERRLKRSPFRDVAGMVRSFHYAAYSGLLQNSAIRPEDQALLEPWIEPWYRYVSSAFLDSYLQTVGGAGFLPTDREELEIMFQAFLLEKAVYEIGYELNNRPDWAIIPARGVSYILKSLSWRQ
ncbi:MAG: maltose alpha-D-glucosyltransferase [Blastocatellia bacterium]|nr:maltose alpha-D-glucosyltransferase [Blastocatellia bacterium]